MKTIVIALGALLVLASCNQDKTAYVDNTVLLKEYKEMKDTEAKYNTMAEAMKKEMDSVAKQFQAEVQEYQSNANSMSNAQRQEAEGKLMQKQQQLQQQQQMRSQQLRAESDKEIDSIITKVKTYVKDYGKDNGYTYIFGSNETANIMYAKEGKDITQDVLEEINAEETFSTLMGEVVEPRRNFIQENALNVSNLDI